MRMKWSLRLAMITVLFFLPNPMGMGVIGDSPTNKIPVPDKKYTVTFIDQMDVVTECSEVSIEGNTFIDGKRGEGTYAIAFDRIRSVLFRMKERELRGAVQLKDGSEIELVLNKDRKAYGKTEFGTFQIKLANLKKMTFPTK
jgi:hypothetical protein